MAHADGVDADGLQVAQPTLPHIAWHHGTQDAGIVVEADAFHLHAAAVEQETTVGVELQGAKPHAHGAAVEGSACGIDEPCLHGIEITLAHIP